ncbi:hypothetical protein H1Z61_12600 [Bacillus aquiflavi]|uniref:Uncharacterized protein n=1 Tax=Bacillus aquiflavi TaxID=2672567 RepID=A0A6B3W0T3_9BACI|nr:hypothetical protein [Bacillus aquiflavi]MBA4537949.1 hypothetical protein [Bacillus aquiflavi]NEY82205.1 hypothetical protein [Bacillus aquiflavi]
MRSNKMVYLFLLIILLTACRRDLPEPEVKNFKNMSLLQSIPVYHPQTIEQEQFYVHHYVKGRNLYVECIVKGISFRSDNHDKKRGKILLYVDGKKVKEIKSAAFIIKGLSLGNHRIKLEIVSPNNKTYHLTKEFYVTIA